MSASDTVFWTCFMGTLAAQLLLVAIVLGIEHYKTWARQGDVPRVARRELSRISREAKAEIKTALEEDLKPYRAGVATLSPPVPPCAAPELSGEACPTCAGTRDFCCTIKCPAGCGEWAAVYQFDHRARGQYRTECAKGHWGDLDPRSELLPPPWRQEEEAEMEGKSPGQ